MPLNIYNPYLWLAGFIAVILAWDRNITDWILIKVKHIFVGIQSYFLKQKILREIQTLENSFYKDSMKSHGEAAASLLNELQAKHGINPSAPPEDRLTRHCGGAGGFDDFVERIEE